MTTLRRTVFHLIGTIVLVAVLALAALLTFTPDAKAGTGDIAKVSQDIRDTYSKLMTPHTGTLDWNTIAGAPDSEQNTIRMEKLRDVTPIAMAMGTAQSLQEFMLTPDYTGTLRLDANNIPQQACLVGGLTAYYAVQHHFSLAQDEINTLQALAYLWYDAPKDSDMSLPEARQFLSTISTWGLAPGAGGFDDGLQHGPVACKLRRLQAA